MKNYMRKYRTTSEAAIRECAQRGLSVHQIGAELDVSVEMLRHVVSLLDIPVMRSRKQPQPAQRWAVNLPNNPFGLTR